VTAISRARRVLSGGERWMARWICAIPILLVCAYLGFAHIDRLPPDRDEFYSMVNSLWTVDAPISPGSVLRSLQVNSPNHMPLYYVLLNVWGHLFGADIALGRLLSVFASLLGLALVYRLARDFVAPIAGIFGMIILASNTVYNHYVWYLRMYPFLVLASGTVLWLYLRLVSRPASPSLFSCLLLAIASGMLLSLHTSGGLLFLAVAACHILHARKNRGWLAVTAAGAAGIVLALPWLINVSAALARGTTPTARPETIVLWKPLIAWHDVLLNGSGLLLLICLAGLLLSLAQKSAQAPMRFVLLGYCVLASLPGYVLAGISDQGRFILVGLMPAALFAAACLYVLHRRKRPLGLLCIAWVVAGLLFQQSQAYEKYMTNRMTFTDLIPWHAISRVAAQARALYPIVVYGTHQHRLYLDSRFGGSQHEHYFARQELDYTAYGDLAGIQRRIRQNALSEQALWLVFRTSKTDAGTAASLRSILHETNYAPCGSRTLVSDSQMILFQWAALDCQASALEAVYQTDLINYEFFGSKLHASEPRLMFLYRWSARAEFEAQDYNLSHQLFRPDWEKVAQLDLPLAHEGALRQYALDFSQEDAGDVRLVAILYDSQTMEKQDWKADSGMMPHMQGLASVTINTR